jgi:hypothetical protein
VLVKHSNIACLNVIVGLLEKSLCFKKPCNSKMLSYFCYSKHKSGRMPPFLTWHISKIVMDSLSLVVTTCVFNKFSSH